ncbi:hypothetical protein DICPUDRAFT_151518 [Dictyostelium purpureum]|uniref:FNIP repeat-containing protein n=1 Tax=Dictyostelium purpureum TaxID=5786 RepID=F0ZJ21_DICPU|nr:uncharacterized protein DICPUDRAFT_151518 [Dictyostelium purpureum]EGC36036.1 hypothetical protein DICPUDRAFT_151518 [Dictyostelium purpureum]|eukprot:XP_003287411.1 hypothetical protein DICPUDRAFT_151518 [Dictyostelium purpureum]
MILKRKIFFYARLYNKSLIDIKVDDNNIVLYGEFSKSIDIHKIKAGFLNKELYPTFILSLPKDLEKLDLCSLSTIDEKVIEDNQPNFYPELKENELPPNLRELSLPYYKYNIKNNILPNSLIKLNLTQFNQKITKGLFPPLLEVLIIPSYTQFIEPRALPETLTELVVGGYNYQFDTVTYGSIPSKVKILKFLNGISCDSILRGLSTKLNIALMSQSTQDTCESIFPILLKDLYIGAKFPFDKIPPNGFFSKKIKKLKLFTNNTPLKKLDWLPSLEELESLSCSIYSLTVINQNTLPQLLKSIDFNVESPAPNKETAKKFLSFLPNSITDLIINGNINFSSDSNIYPNSLNKLSLENNSHPIHAESSKSLKTFRTISCIGDISLPPNSTQYIISFNQLETIALKIKLSSIHKLPVCPPSLTILDLQSYGPIDISKLPQTIKTLIISGPPPTINIGTIPPTVDQILIDSTFFLEYLNNNQHLNYHIYKKLIIPINNNFDSLFINSYNNINKL